MNINEILCTDTGPGNTMMDAFTQQHFKGKHFDEDAAIALKGNINTELLIALKNISFFKQALPKTTGPELFNLDYLQQAKERSLTKDISVEDTMATLNKFSADTIIDALLKTISKKDSIKIYASGGGMHNPLMMQHIKAALPNCEFLTTADLDIEPDAKEAVLFAVLANECICGDGIYLKKGNLSIPPVSMGKISFPS
jgi:anhydro-N-acetylmuramic acid kinase